MRNIGWERPYIIGHTLKRKQVVSGAGETRGVPGILPALKGCEGL